MTKTDNYNLNQWEATDPIRREDFNADNAVIDAALKEVAGRRPFVVGTYVGTGSTTTTQTVELGFRPSMVIIAYPNDSNGQYGTTITPDCSLSYNESVIAQITETGFEIGLALSGGSPVKPYTNSSVRYVYIAFR